MADLTAKERAFIERYLVCWNGAQAARDAGYSERTAKEQASRMLTKVNVQEAIQERLSELKMSADEVLSRLTEQARASVAPFLITTDAGVPSGFNLSPDRPLHLVKKVTITDKGISFELHDAQAALALLGKHHKLFTDKIEHTGADGQPLFKVYEKTDAFDPDDA